MSNLTIGVIVGSLRKASFNRQLAQALVGLLPSGATAHNQDLDASLPEPVQRFKAAVAGVDALLFVTPEYNRGIPGVLKNAIDWGSRPYGQSVWDGKPAGIAGASPGAIGTALSQAQLRNVLAAVGVKVLPLPEVFFHFAGEPFDAQGGVTDARTRQFLQGFVDRFVQWAGQKPA
jgi:chromate reductase, NAD(P)H dehydrogenase (quinone)